MAEDIRKEWGVCYWGDQSNFILLAQVLPASVRLQFKLWSAMWAMEGEARRTEVERANCGSDPLTEKH